MMCSNHFGVRNLLCCNLLASLNPCMLFLSISHISLSISLIALSNCAPLWPCPSLPPCSSAVPASLSHCRTTYSVCRSINLSLYLSIYMYLYIHLYIYLCIYLYISTLFNCVFLPFSPLVCQSDAPLIPFACIGLFCFHTHSLSFLLPFPLADTQRQSTFCPTSFVPCPTSTSYQRHSKFPVSPLLQTCQLSSLSP